MGRPGRTRRGGRPGRTLPTVSARRPIALLSATVLFVAVAVAGCSSSDDGMDTDVPLEAQPVLSWTDAGGGVDIAQLLVPRDHAAPDGESISLYVARHRATDPTRRVGTLLVNPGGPGAAGSVLAERADEIYSPRLLAAFDIVGWDPRGVGRSEPAVDCVDELDPLFALDITPDTPADDAAIASAIDVFVAGCRTRSAAVLPFMSTEQSAGDMESLRVALGEERVSYFGFSYGSELGAMWLTRYPATVRAAVLDGAVDPRATAEEEAIQQAVGFERALGGFLDQCAGDTGCPFHSGGQAQQAFDELLATIDATPVPTGRGRVSVTSGVALVAVAQAMYASTAWPRLEQALADARDGKGDGLLALYDQYVGRDARGGYDNTLEAFFATSCLDDGDGADLDRPALASRLAEVAPRLGALWQQPDVCPAWPARAPAPPAVTGEGAPAVVVVGTTGDPATPIEASQGMADALAKGVLVTVAGAEHTGYGLNDCIDGVVDSYLIALTVPADGTTC